MGQRICALLTALVLCSGYSRTEQREIAYAIGEVLMVERAHDACMCTAVTCITVSAWLPNYRPCAWRGQFARALLGLDH